MTTTQDLIARLRSAGADGGAIYCWARCTEAADALEHKNNLLHSFLAVLKTDRHDWEDWPSNSRNVVAAIVKEPGQ